MAKINPNCTDPPVLLKVEPRECETCGEKFVPVSSKGSGAKYCPTCRQKMTETARKRSLEARTKAEILPRLVTRLKWYNTADILPERSCNVFTLTKNGTIWALPYSKKYKLFNAWDIQREETVEENSIGVILWAHIPEELNAIRGSILDATIRPMEEEQ